MCSFLIVSPQTDDMELISFDNDCDVSAGSGVPSLSPAALAGASLVSAWQEGSARCLKLRLNHAMAAASGVAVVAVDMAAVEVGTCFRPCFYRLVRFFHVWSRLFLTGKRGSGANRVSASQGRRIRSYGAAPQRSRGALRCTSGVPLQVTRVHGPLTRIAIGVLVL